MLDFKTLTPAAAVGMVLTLLIVLAAVFAPFVAPYGMAEIVGDVWEPASAAHWFGTDNIGRDLLTRIIYGARITLFIAVLATALSFILGSVLGFMAAVIGGWFDTLISRAVDLLMSIPTLIMGLVVLSVLPRTTLILILVMGILDSTRVYRLSRAVAVDINVMDFVEAAKLRGEGTLWIVFREILPNALSPLVAELGVRFIFAILFLSTLSFLGLGVQPPTPDLGSMVAEGAKYLPDSWWLTVFPGLAILVAVFGFNLIGDAMREILGADE